MTLPRLRLPRPAVLIAALGLLGLLLSGCGMVQYDPSGQNSGSPENAQGAFNFNTNAADVATGSVGQTMNIYDTFSSVVTAFTVNSVKVTTDSANLNPDIHLPSDEQFLVMSVTMKNNSASPTSCANPNATKCVEYFSPLQNFRLRDNQGRDWSTTTGAMEACSNDPHTLCASRTWIDLAMNGIAPGASATEQLAFLVPLQSTPLTLYFAPYRFSDTNPGLAGGTASGVHQTTAAAIAISY